jgi:anthranilate phosphoribosyltransferase
VNWADVLQPLLAGQDLDTATAERAMTHILSGAAGDAQIAAFAVALRAKGESAAEVAALVDVMVQHANRVEVDGVVLDVVGTGGDGAGTVNISTMAALVCAAAGARVVKHGNRAVTSHTGTADVLEQLGVVIELQPAQVAATVQEVGIGFCFAPIHHPAMRHAGPARKALGVPTVFNILGPLSNPAGAGAALIGCADRALAPVMADALRERGTRALVVRGDDGLDEISIAGVTTVWDATGDSVVVRTLDAEELGIVHASTDALAGGMPEENAAILLQVLNPGQHDERLAAIRDAVALNAAAALVVYDIACGATPITSDADLRQRTADALQRARAALESGAAQQRLDSWREVTQRV